MYRTSSFTSPFGSLLHPPEFLSSVSNELVAFSCINDNVMKGFPVEEKERSHLLYSKCNMSCGLILFWSIEAAVSGKHCVCVSSAVDFSQYDCRCKVVGLQRSSYFWFWSTASKPLHLLLTLLFILSIFFIAELEMSGNITLSMFGQLSLGRWKYTALQQKVKKLLDTSPVAIL